MHTPQTASVWPRKVWVHVLFFHTRTVLSHDPDTNMPPSPAARQLTVSCAALRACCVRCKCACMCGCVCVCALGGVAACFLPHRQPERQHTRIEALKLMHTPTIKELELREKCVFIKIVCTYGETLFALLTFVYSHSLTFVYSHFSKCSRFILATFSELCKNGSIQLLTNQWGFHIRLEA